MKKQQLIRAAAATVLGLGLTTGFAAADINTTGPGSNNQVNTTATSKNITKNRNHLNVNNHNGQSSYSGSANVSGNTNGGSATSGSASNSNSTSVSASVSNSSSSAASYGGSWAMPAQGTISTTGPGSNNQINTTLTSTNVVKNHNDISVCNDNAQGATSGSANVSGNTNGGSATSGSASNSNNSSFSLNVSN